MSALVLFARGALASLAPETLDALLSRRGEPDAETSAIVARIVDDVRVRGDEALTELAVRFDGVRLAHLEVPRTRWLAELEGLDGEVRRALERAAENVRAFHAALRPADVRVEVEPDVVVTRTSVPVGRAGIYAPGGSAAYPSSVLMGVVPARAAGVDEVVVCSPPGPSGEPPAEVLAACALAGADRLFAVGGAGAVAAMAFGTESVPRVDVLVGPGNRWVTEAKRQVAGRLPIDALAGPSEVLVVADRTADARLAALELVAQAEHDPDAACALVTDSEPVAEAVHAELSALVRDTPRKEVASRALAARGAILLGDTLEACLDFGERYAPEHLVLMTADAARQARRARSAGTVFVGPWASVVFGDYLSGANHVLPTSGRARAFSGLSTQHFLRSYTIQEIGRAGAAALAEDVHTLAEAEGLPAHGAAALARRSA